MKTSQIIIFFPDTLYMEDSKWNDYKMETQPNVRRLDTSFFLEYAITATILAMKNKLSLQVGLQTKCSIKL